MMSIDTLTTIELNDLSLWSELEEITETIVRPIVRRALHVSLRIDDMRTRNQDALELVGDIQVMIIAAVDARNENGHRSIRHLRGYSAKTAANACYSYLRTMFPERARQENKLRYALKHMDGISLWKAEDGDWLCGPSTCQDMSDPSPIDSSVVRTWSSMETRDGYLSAVRSVAAHSRGPVLFDDLLDLIVEALGIKEATVLSLDNEWIKGVGEIGGKLSGDAADPTPQIARLWQELVQMPLNHRKVLLLNLKHKGSDLLKVFPLCGIATLDDIARALEFGNDEFLTILNSLPWDDLRLADHLGVTRQQVINVRHYVRSRLYRVRVD